MVSYPKTLPTDAAMILVGAATNGIQPSGEHGDVACVAQAAWNLLGYGLSVALPHDHPDLVGTPKKKTALAPPSPAALPRTQGGQLNQLASLLAPVAVKRQKGIAVAAPDWSKLPWDQIIALAVLLIRSLLQK